MTPSTSDLVTVRSGARSLTFWPFSGLSASRADAADPVNLVFLGRSDPRNIRAALLALDGDRSPAWPDAFPFDRPWSDAMGPTQTAFLGPHGWTACAVQLQCGAYGPVRVHVRLYSIGGWTLGTAHMDLQIPGTAEHAIVDWQRSADLVLFDLDRAGVVAAEPVTSGSVTPASYRELPAVLLPAVPPGLRDFLGLPASSSRDLPLVHDGAVRIVELREAARPADGERHEKRTVPLDQAFPRPVCRAGPDDWIRVTGALTLENRTAIEPEGDYRGRFTIEGAFEFRPVDPRTGESRGPARTGRIEERLVARVGDGGAVVRSVQRRRATGEGPAQELRTRLVVDGRGRARGGRREICGDRG